MYQKFVAGAQGVGTLLLLLALWFFSKLVDAIWSAYKQKPGATQKEKVESVLNAEANGVVNRMDKLVKDAIDKAIKEVAK